MNFFVDPNSPLPPYIQVANQIADQIRSGNMPKGTRLPSVRSLVTMARISHVTANKVLEYLEEKRLIERIQGSGSFSIFNPPFGPDQSLPVSYVREQFSAVHKSKEFRSVLVNLLKNTTHVCPYNFSYALLEPSFVNILIPSPMDSRLKLNQVKWTRTYGEMVGMLELRHTLVDCVAPNRSIEEVLITHGNQHGISLVADTLIMQGDYILMETPTFTGAVDVFANAKARILPLRIFEDGFDEDYIEKLCKKYRPKLFFLTPNFSNPTGYCLTHEERNKLLELAEKYDFFILEDDHWSELSFKEKVLPLGLMEDTINRVIYLKGFSKIVGPDCRIGSLFAHEKLIQEFKKTLTIQSLGVSLLSQHYLLALLKYGYYQNALLPIISDLKKRSIITNQILSPLRSYGVDYDLPEGGLNYWVKLPEHLNSEELLFNAMYPKGITFLPGSITNSTDDSSWDHCLRLNFSYLSLNNLKSGLSKFVDLLKDEM